MSDFSEMPVPSSFINPEPYSWPSEASSPASTPGNSRRNGRIPDALGSNLLPSHLVPTGIKVITSMLLPHSTWDKNNIRDLRFTETHGLPPKIEG